MKTVKLSIITFLILFVFSYLVLPANNNDTVGLSASNNVPNNNTKTINTLNKSDFK